MNLAAAVHAAAPGASPKAANSLLELDPESPALANEHRASTLIGQCAHESAGFTRLVESLYYTTPERLMVVWPGRFKTRYEALQFCREPEKLASHVYGQRDDLGNTKWGDGWRYRGRGWLQLTGRANYRDFGRLIGVDLEEQPEMAASPAVAWEIAASYLDTRSRGGKTALEWADLQEVENVTRIVNGGLHGIEDRRQRTAEAFMALKGQITLREQAEGPDVVVLQRRLLAAGFDPGPVDGLFGPRTSNAVRGFQKASGLTVDGIAGPKTWAALGA